jgi:hypothetical protein
MEAFDTKLIDTIQELAEYFSLLTVQRWAANLKRQKLVASRELINSLDQDTRADLSKLVVTMLFAYEEYGKYPDIKRKRWTKQPPVEEILAWVKKKGLSSFGQDPHPYKRRIKSAERRYNEIAWGIARSYTRRGRQDKPKPWLRSSFYKGLNALQTQLATGVADTSIESMKETLLWRMKRQGAKYY